MWASIFVTCVAIAASNNQFQDTAPKCKIMPQSALFTSKVGCVANLNREKEGVIEHLNKNVNLKVKIDNLKDNTFKLHITNTQQPGYISIYFSCKEIS